MRLITPQDLQALLRPAVKRPTARERAEQNRLRVLALVGDFGHLTCAHIAAGCWPEARYALQMAQRCVRDLTRRGELLARSNAIGSRTFVLTRRGAAALEVRGIGARHGLDLATSGGNFMHHALTSRYCIQKRQEGYLAFSEYALINRRAPVTAQHLITRYGKLPDAVLIQDTRLYLVETESAPKSREKVSAIAGLAAHVGERINPDLPYVLGGIVIVFDRSLNHGERMQRIARARWTDCNAHARASLAARITLARIHLDLPLMWRGYSEAPLSL